MPGLTKGSSRETGANEGEWSQQSKPNTNCVGSIVALALWSLFAVAHQS
ncbi:MAG: hypothetical protein U9P70_03965 [Patescibacteria group bacterium]|nr:hypothetical protein [Patescibacteria group bacterium]